MGRKSRDSEPETEDSVLFHTRQPLIQTSDVEFANVRPTEARHGCSEEFDDVIREFGSR